MRKKKVTPKVYISNANGTFTHCEGMTSQMLESYIMIGAEFEAIQAIRENDLEEVLDIARDIRESIDDNRPVIYNSKIVSTIAEIAEKEGIRFDVSKVKYKKMPKLSLDEQMKLAGWL